MNLTSKQGDEMKQEELEEIGVVCFGRTWQSQVADRIGVNVRTLQNWQGKRNNIPHQYHEKIRELPKTRLKEIERYVKRR